MKKICILTLVICAFVMIISSWNVIGIGVTGNDDMYVTNPGTDYEIDPEGDDDDDDDGGDSDDDRNGDDDNGEYNGDDNDEYKGGCDNINTYDGEIEIVSGDGYNGGDGDGDGDGDINDRLDNQWSIQTTNENLDQVNDESFNDNSKYIDEEKVNSDSSSSLTLTPNLVIVKPILISNRLSTFYSQFRLILNNLQNSRLI